MLSTPTKYPLALILAFAGVFGADVLGDFSSVSNDTGYLSFDRESVLFSGNLDLDDKKEGISVEYRTPSRLIFEDFVDAEKDAFRPEAILDRIVRLADEEVMHFDTYCKGRGEECEEEPMEVYERWMHRKSHVGYRFAYDRLKEAYDLAVSFNTGGHLSKLQITPSRINENLPEIVAFRRALLEGLEVAESLGLDAAGTTKRTNKLSSILSLLRNNRRRHTIKGSRVEASNLRFSGNELDNPSFYSPEQLASFEGDISTLDPIGSGFWRKPHQSIATYNTTNYHRQGVASMEASLDAATINSILDPTLPVDVVYEEDDLGGRTPKVTVQIGGQNWKLKYATHRRATPFTMNPSKTFQKRWLGSEVGVEPVVNNLAAAIGYTVDPTYFQQRIRLYFKDKVYKGSEEEQRSKFEEEREEMLEDLQKAFPQANVHSAFQNIQIDDTGRRYIEVREVTLEKKSDARTDVNLGYFIRAGYGKAFKREFRAFSIFLAWIADPDIKDSNVKAKLVPVHSEGSESSYRLVYSASDMGGALGTGFPNLFKKDFIDKIRRDDAGRFVSMRLTYRSIFPAPLLRAVSYADYRWIARMIGQLTREQILKAFLSSGHPDVVAQYYTEILLRRRDQMVEAAGLMGETYVDVYGHETKFEPLSQMANPKSFAVEGYEEYFKKGKLRYKGNQLFDDSLGYFPRYWGSKYPWSS